MTDWLTDDNGNRCSVDYFGSREAAQAALDSLKNCQDCINCSDCLDCSNCSGCSDCLDCSHCLYCSDCWNCWYCLVCSGCSNKKDLKDKGGDFTPPTIPVIADIHQKVFEAVSQPQALDMSDWHTCSTTHCRAGWVVHLAGEAGYALERFHNTPLAAQLIYRASGYRINTARFYDSNKDAMADMARLAHAPIEGNSQ